MHEDQFGFVKGRSTEHALLATVNEIEKGLHKKEFVIATLLDIKGAFDNIKPLAIIKAMRKQGVRQKQHVQTVPDKQEVLVHPV